MAIGSGDAIEKFGAQVAITNAGVTISSGAMSIQADAVAWTNSDDVTDADILVEATFAAATNGGIDIFARKLNVRGANDENEPTIGDNEDRPIENIALDAGNAGQVKTARVQLPNGKSAQEYEFYFKNSGGQNIIGMQAWITPIANGAKA